MNEPNEIEQVQPEPDRGPSLPDSGPDRPAAPAPDQRPASPTRAQAESSRSPASTQPPNGGALTRSAARVVRGRVHTIHYELSYLVLNADQGPRGAIVLLHDLPGGAFAWQSIMPALAATGRAVYAFDMLGYGDSDHPWPADCTVWGHADNLSPAFEALGLQDVVLVGIGVGGGVAQVLATRLFREGVAALALLDTYAYTYAYAPDWPMTEMEQRHDPDAPRHTSTEQMLANLRATLPNGSVNPKQLAGSALDAYVAPWNSDLGRELLFQHIRQMLPNYTLSVASDLKQMSIPTLIIWGEEDRVTPLALGRRLERDIPGARMALIPSAGHLLLNDAPGRVGELIVDFITKARQ